MSQPFMVDIPLGTLHGLRWGRPGDVPVLALHGWMDNAASFVPLAAHLPGLDLIALDLPGHGRSPHLPVGGEYTLHGALHVVLDVADALGWERFSLLGHSMGAGISCLLAAACPERIQRMVLIDGLAIPEHPGRTVARMRESVSATRSRNVSTLRVFPDLDTPIQARMQVNALDADSARLLVERGVRQVEGGYRWSSDPLLMLPSFRYMNLPQIEAMMEGIECPVRVMFSQNATPLFPRAQKLALAHRIPRSEVFELPGIHHLHMQRPADVARLAADFLRGDESQD